MSLSLTDDSCANIVQLSTYVVATQLEKFEKQMKMKKMKMEMKISQVVVVVDKGGVKSREESDRQPRAKPEVDDPLITRERTEWRNTHSDQTNPIGHLSVSPEHSIKSWPVFASILFSRGCWTF